MCRSGVGRNGTPTKRIARSPCFAGLPKSTFVGYDFHPASIDQARVHGKQHGASTNTQFEVGLAGDYPARDLDFVTFFDCLHDIGDPVGAARHALKSLKPNGSLMVVEPQAGDRLEDNLNPLSRMSYAASTFVCLPTSLNQPVGAALGAQAGFAKLKAAIAEGDRFRSQGDRESAQYGARSPHLSRGPPRARERTEPV